jgi:HSP20 family molecular chaperone IbpA
MNKHYAKILAKNTADKLLASLINVIESYDLSIDSLRSDLLSFFTKKTATAQPNYAVYEYESGYSVIIELPGYSKDKIDITTQENAISIKATKTNTTSNAVFDNRLQSVDFSITLGSDINPDSIKASFKEGELTILFDKKVPKRKVTID